MNKTLNLLDKTKVSPKTQYNNKKAITLVTTQKHDSSIDKLSGVHMDNFVQSAPSDENSKYEHKKKETLTTEIETLKSLAFIDAHSEKPMLNLPFQIYLKHFTKVHSILARAIIRQALSKRMKPSKRLGQAGRNAQL